MATIKTTPPSPRRQRKQQRQQRKFERKFIKSHGAESPFERLRAITSLLTRVAIKSITNDKQGSERVIYEGFMNLGGVYVKFLQLLVLRSKFFTKLSAEEKMAVYDNVNVDDINIREYLSKTLGSNYTDTIVHVEDQPFSSGSFAQVYYATHADGTPLIIKLLKPSLVQNIRNDLRVLGVVVFMLKRQLKMATDAGALFKNFKGVMLLEIDYDLETSNARYFYNYYQDMPDVVIPKTYMELCTSTIIVQDYLDGLPLTDVISSIEHGKDPVEFTYEQTGSNLLEQMNMIGRELIVSIFLADKTYGDPHPGNLKLLADNKVGLIDFGVAGVPPDDRRAFMILIQDIIEAASDRFDPGMIFINGMRYFTPDLYRSLNTISLTYSQRTEGGSSEIMDEIKTIAARSLEANKEQVDIEALIKSGHVSKVMNTVINQDNKFSFRVAMEPGSSIALRIADGYLSMLSALEIVDELIPKVIVDAVDQVHASGKIIKGRSETIEYETAVNVVSDWTQSLIESDPMFFSPLIQKLRTASATVQKATNQEGIVAQE